MNFKIVFFGLLVSMIISSCTDTSTSPKSGVRVLVFAKTTGFRHSSIPNGKAAIKKLGRENNFEADITEDASVFTEDNLKKYAAIVFLNTTGDVLNYKQEAAMERYIQSGGGFAGIHSATDTEYDWIWYAKLVGGNFESHPKPQQAKIIVVDTTHPSTRHLADVWERFDEWYNFKNLNKDVHVLLKIDEKSYDGGKLGDDHPMAWYHEYDGGRAFYTELGHTDESYSEQAYLNHILGGIQYAMGDNKRDYSKAKTQFPPDEKSLTKTKLVGGNEFFEPTEMTILPNLDVLVVQRRGEILLYKNDSKKLLPAGQLKVYSKSSNDANVEEGLLGVCKDPGFSKNNWVYIFYSPIDTSVNRLSRFTLKDDKIDMTSEKIVLQFYSQREICCHTGGSIAFGGDGLLYLSTGDNSTPFDVPKQGIANHGFSPMDNRAGLEPYDARRSSSNSNDLRGKVIRFKVNEDGSYSIPDGNLFAKDQPGTRPEIYAMGTRNAYRLSVDQKTNYVYWGDVGPDSDKDSLETRGPKGYDEINQARKAGYFGWPLFIGNNYAYYEYDYNTGKTGTRFDPDKPVNNSKNNTGIKELPPATPAFIWYPYSVAYNQFPQMGTGGRTAMAGPVYYSDMFPGKKGLPDYYNGKLFIYEWMRNIIKAVSLQPNGDFYKMEPFMEGTKLYAPIDMELGPDGHLYILEYGLGWFSKNKDSGLYRIDYKE